jgi:hypothetical protein
MGRSFARDVALLALLTVISSAQCVNFCAVHPCNDAPPVTPAHSAQSCHHSPASSKPEPTKPDSNCIHQPMLVSEKVGSAVLGALSLTVLPMFSVYSGSDQVSAPILIAHTTGSSPTLLLTRTVILRI